MSKFRSQLNDENLDEVAEFLGDSENQDQDEEHTQSNDQSAIIAQLKNKISELETQISVQKLEINDWKERSYRISADNANITKQHELDLTEARKLAKKSIVNAFLPFLNSIYLSFSYIPEEEMQTPSSYTAIFRTSFDKVLSDLKAFGVELLIPTVGEDVDTQYMAVVNQAEDNSTPKIKSVVSIGVRIDGQLVREATVMV